jgi:hypothetical protein
MLGSFNWKALAWRPDRQKCLDATGQTAWFFVTITKSKAKTTRVGET